MLATLLHGHQRSAAQQRLPTLGAAFLNALRVFRTFDTELEARHYGTQLHTLLASGLVSAELFAQVPAAALDPLVAEIIGNTPKLLPLLILMINYWV